MKQPVRPLYHAAILTIAAASLLPSMLLAQRPFVVRAGPLALTVSSRGAITGAAGGRLAGAGPAWSAAVRGQTLLDSCSRENAVRRTTLPGGGIQFVKMFVSANARHQARVTERFLPDSGSIRWEIEVEGTGAPWTTGIATVLTFPDTAGERFWTPWGDPYQISPAERGEHPHAWHSPFASKPFRDMHLVYGGHFSQGAGYALPVFSVLYPHAKTGLSLAMSPEDPLLDLHMVTTRGGSVTQTRKFHRLEKGKKLSFTMHLFAHGTDWRSVVGFLVERYPRFFLSPLKDPPRVSGLGAYSAWEGPIDVEKYRKMGGIVNWKASFDFSYMGMFIPPVPTDTTRWRRFDVDTWGEPVPGKVTYSSIARMRDYARTMKDLGFSTLNYFNITEFGGSSEFGKTVAYPEPRFTGRETTWTNPSAFLYQNFPGALLFGSLEHVGWHKRTSEHQMFNPVQFHQEPYPTWGGAVATDVGDSAYAAFLLAQAERHVRKIPDAQGLCIDRFDWFNDYNWHADDGVSWAGGRPVRALLNSYRSFMPRLAQVMHRAGKVIFCNPHMNRLELMEHIDGIYNEFSYIGHNLNLSAFLALSKPFLSWTPNRDTVLQQGDRLFQTHILMGAFPTAPFPGNDHTIGPDSAAERYYLDYGPMFNRLHGRTWVLVPEAIEVQEDAALCNLFSVGERLVVPLVLGRADSAAVVLRQCDRLLKGSAAAVEIWHPGAETPLRETLGVQHNTLALTVPLHRGCALLVITPRQKQ